MTPGQKIRKARAKRQFWREVDENAGLILGLAALLAGTAGAFCAVFGPYL